MKKLIIAMILAFTASALVPSISFARHGADDPPGHEANEHNGNDNDDGPGHR